MWTPDQIQSVVEQNKVVLFAKGTRFEPMCGFSAKAIHILDQLVPDYHVVNIFDDASIRPALVQFSSWPTTPQLFIDGELIGGSDIMEELLRSGELKQKLAAAGAA
ncbi:MAG TPA: Grx4 family monothiol glutaredoxin [Planctomycetota bacterium]|nr:Grx4 family monothiol glutaredoxin [Planctomycetota bacterium]